MTDSQPTQTTFAQLGLAAPLLRALAEKNYTQPSPIQAGAIPHLLAGRDIMGSAQTGTGKTAAFALPILHLLSARPAAKTPSMPRALILTPTRELAVQIGVNFSAYGRYLPLRHVVIYGGVGQGNQVRGLAQGAEIVIATPGRLLDLAQQGEVRFDRVEIFVLDEADRMLDMGFAPAIKRITGWLPPQRQSLLFSATLPSSILSLASRIVRDPVRVEMKSETPAAEGIAQEVCHVAQGDKYALLRHVLDESEKGLVLVFSRTKHGAKKLAKNLSKDGYPSEDIHGNKSQSARQRSLENFRSGKVRVLVATDVAARGLDVKGIALVVNYNIPHEPEAYVHRIGRTARAGTLGRALSFCEPAERGQLRDIQRLLRTTIPVRDDHPFTKSSPASRDTSVMEHSSSPPRQHDHHRAHSHSVPNRNHRHDEHRHFEQRSSMPVSSSSAGSAPRREDDRAPQGAPREGGPRRSPFPPAKHGWFVRQRRGGQRSNWDR